ncbi:MAG: glycoside hydrolase family 3 protein [Actinobacteria bacterium]|nr:MAG: glycoside hydrolase family 3 protein [Actinomycetota bacterium]
MAIDPGLRRLALSTLLPAFRGHEAPGWITDLIDEGVAGCIIFGYNIVDRGQLTALTGQLREVRSDLLLSIDEEGGDVTRLAHAAGSPYPGNAALGAIDDVELTERIYRAIGRDLLATGFNVNLAPTVDVNTADDNPVIGTRSFGSDPARVAAQSAAAVVGLQSVGVAACVKHFPGHGGTSTDSHLDLPTLDVGMEVLRERDLTPFVAAIKAGTQAVMTAHIRVPVLTGDLPATLSRAAMVDLLRRELGFAGVVITDALEMRAAAEVAGGTAAAAARALAAGNDLLCLGSRVDAVLVEDTVAEIVAGIEAGWLPLTRVEEAAERVAGLAAWALATRTEGPVEDGIGYPAAQRAIRVEGSLAGLGDPLIVQVLESDDEINIAVGPGVPWGLAPHVNGTEHVQVGYRTATPEALRAAAGTRPIVLVGRNLHRLPGTARLIEDLAATHPVVTVEMGWPSNWRPHGVRAFVTTYGASRANGWAAASALGLLPRAGHEH